MLHLLRDIPITGASTRDALKKDKPIGTLTADLWETPEVHPELPWAVRFGANTPGVHRVLGVAGGSGCFCIALALRYPGMRLTVAGLPAVCPLTQAYVAEYSLQVIACLKLLFKL